MAQFENGISKFIPSEEKFGELCLWQIFFRYRLCEAAF